MDNISHRSGLFAESFHLPWQSRGEQDVRSRHVGSRKSKVAEQEVLQDGGKEENHVKLWDSHSEWCIWHGGQLA